MKSFVILFVIALIAGAWLYIGYSSILADGGDGDDDPEDDLDNDGVPDHPEDDGDDD